MSIGNAIKRTVTAALQDSNRIPETETIEQVRSIGGGDVSDAFLCKTNTGNRIFVKVCCSTSSGQSIDDIVNMFKSEAEGLKALDDTHTIRVPTPYAHGVLEGEKNCGYLATEYIAMGGKHTPDIQRKYGEQLADMHLAPGPDQFGFPVNNTIGSTPQDNTWTSDYLEFLHRRLKYQFDLASRHPQVKKAGQELLDRLPSYFEGLDPIRPSLQHGDLWSGNWSSDDQGNPVIFDPAPFYGHSESDLGIMQLFGGVNEEFYKAYHSKIPKAPGFEKRLSIYTLYHAVNHLNMFGSSYLGTCMSLFSDILGD